MTEFFLASILCVLGALAPVDAVLRRSGHATENLQPYTNHGLAAAVQNMNSLLVQDITSKDWDMNEKGLINSADSRFSRQSGIHKAAGMLEAEFRGMGLSVEIDNYDPSHGPNIIAKLNGRTSESVLVGAHYDSLPSSGTAPGADDNASGVATMLSVAQALAQIKLTRTVVFVAFSGEEEGLVGSEYFATKIAPYMNIVGSIILDQDGNPGTSHGLILESVGNSTDKLRIIDTLADSVDPSIGLPLFVNYDGFGSDHVSLSKVGIPSVLVIERENMKFAQDYGHTSRDDLSHIDPAYGSAIARTVLKAVVRLAS